MMNVQRVDPDDDRSSWPYLDMLGFGYFGSRLPAGRRHRNRGVALLAVFVVAALAVVPTSFPWAVRVICAVIVPMAWVGIVWSNVRYFSELDELSRLIQLEAAALSYGAVFVLASIWYALGMLDVLGTVPEAGVAATQVGGRMRSFWPLFAVLVVVEPLRGLALVRLARSRQ
jgi:hypothetical protein